jgi:hypothetical protein
VKNETQNIVELTIARPDGSIEEQARQALASAELVVITTPEQFLDAGETLARLKGKAKQLEETRLSLTRPIDESKKRIMEFFRAPLAYLEKAESILKKSIGDYRDEQERIAREEQRKRDEEARKERERLQALARKQMEKGNEERAQATLERAAAVVPASVVADVPKLAGLTTVEVWKFEVTDAALLPRVFTMPDEQKIRRQVAALKGDTIIPGVRVWSEKSTRSGSM